MEVGSVSRLPKGWEWKTSADLSEYITSGSRGWKADMTSARDSFIRSQDIRQDALIYENPAFVSLPERVEDKRTLVRGGDLRRREEFQETYAGPLAGRDNQRRCMDSVERDDPVHARTPYSDRLDSQQP